METTWFNHQDPCIFCSLLCDVGARGPPTRGLFGGLNREMYGEGRMTRLWTPPQAPLAGFSTWSPELPLQCPLGVPERSSPSISQYWGLKSHLGHFSPICELSAITKQR